MINEIKVEGSIVKTDYLIWKNARSNDKGFHQHETSKCHQQAIKNLIEILKFTKGVTTMFKTNTTETQRVNRTSLLKIISYLLYLTCQGLSFRRHGDKKDINFKQLIRFRAEDDPALPKWLKEKNLSYTSPEIQNEILKNMSLSILHDLVNCIKKSENLGGWRFAFSRRLYRPIRNVKDGCNSDAQCYQRHYFEAWLR